MCYVDAGFCHGEGVGVMVDVDFMGYKEMLREMRTFKRCDLKRGCETLGWALLESLCDLHTCKKRVIAVIYQRKFFWIFRKILG